MKKFRASYTIAIGFAAVAFLALYGYRFANDLLLSGNFAPLKPGKVDIVGLDTSKAGFAIIVSNGIAKLIVGDRDQFKAGSMDEKALEADSSEKSTVPIKEMQRGINGDGDALGFFVERLNRIDETSDTWPANAPVWKFDAIEKAMRGDQALRKKLVVDLNVQLDGTPLGQISKSAFANGILVDVPVSLQVESPKGRETVIARVRTPYRPRFLVSLETQLKGRYYDSQTLANEYAAEARKVLTGETPRENVAASIAALGSAKRIASLAQIPQAILDSLTTVVNEDHIERARYEPVVNPSGTTYKLIIDLDDEGKRRLYQFSRDRVNSQLLVTVNGVAIAAPFISHGLSSGEVEITRMQDEDVVRDAVETINSMRATKQ